MCVSVPVFMVFAFLGITLLVGLYFGRQPRSFRDYAVGTKRFAASTLAATVLATSWGGGGLLRTVEQVHRQGLYWILLSLIGFFGAFWLVRTLASRMAPFMHHLSMPETIGSVYGAFPRLVVALSQVVFAVIGLAIQIRFVSAAVSMCTDWADVPWMTGLVASIFIFYASWGGIRAVVATHLLHFAAFALLLPCLLWFVFSKGQQAAVDLLPFAAQYEKFQLSSLFRGDNRLVGFVLCLLSFSFSGISPTTMQGVYMSSSPRQAKRVFTYVALLSTSILTCILLIGLSVFAAVPHLPGSVWGYVFATMPPLWKGFVAIGLLAMTLSTADACLHSCSVLVGHDILSVFRGSQKPPCRYKLHVARGTSLLVGFFAALLVLRSTDLFALLKCTLHACMPISTAPYLLAICGFRGTTCTALIGMGAGLTATLVWQFWIEPGTAIDGSVPCMLANGLAMLLAHYRLPQPPGTGWMGKAHGIATDEASIGAA